MIKPPTPKQVDLAQKLGISVSNQTFRVLGAEIADQLDRLSDEYVQKYSLQPGTLVEYIGSREDMPSKLTISSYGKNCFLYFKGIHKHCRPMDVKPIESGKAI